MDQLMHVCLSVPAHLEFLRILLAVPPRDVDFDYKTACFYVDWDSSYNIPKFAIPADKHQLKDNIGYFRKETKKLVW
jgi:hypothetical protein